MDKVTADRIITVLGGVFSDKPALKFSSPYELLVAVMLSAQCTDERVNKVTEKLFKDFNTPEKMIMLTEAELEKKIFSCGLYKTKAKHILETSNDIIVKFGGSVPGTLEELRSLAGVGRKTANVVFSVAFGGNAIAVDTHVFRVSNRIGLTCAKDPLATEKGLMSILKEEKWSKAHHYLIYLGRSFCKAQTPNCKGCPITDICEKNIKKSRSGKQISK